MPKGNWEKAQLSAIDSRMVVDREGRKIGTIGPNGTLSSVFGIGDPDGPGFGVGVCTETLPRGMVPLYGADDPYAPTRGNYQTADGSIMCWIPEFVWKWGNGTNGLAINGVQILDARVFDGPTHAAALGFASRRSFIDGGRVKSGYFVDKYKCSAGANGMAVSIKGGNPLSSHVDHSPFSALNGAPPNNYGGALAAAKTRGPKFFASSRAMRSDLGLLAYARAMASASGTWCAWWDATNNFVKGCNNNSLRDSQDAGVLYTSDGYSNCGKTGSGVPFNKTTHNGEESGVADLNGLMWEVTPGLTSDGTSFYILKKSVEMASLTGGNTLATDAWGAAGLAANYTNIGATYGALLASGTTKLFGNAAQVFDSAQSGVAWEMACLGIPLVGGTGGTNAFGNDGLYDYRPNDMCTLSGGTWYTGSPAGVWALNLAAARSNSNANVGFRAALYL
ncbi:hypothetical protein [Accumulibacter sp.]|uniref:hypothetical protein n=1 Tax=Accumulibacter sp. TaxID=2053492 RepID=UPI001ACE9950|nr:hypothetical protein [Accumulibacter sp.]MBN8516229.1 hypothetical protein [Accumulibacter sp.]MBO3704272.1 hypothetical protein [Accumulibacter sp.]